MKNLQPHLRKATGSSRQSLGWSKLRHREERFVVATLSYGLRSQTRVAERERVTTEDLTPTLIPSLTREDLSPTCCHKYFCLAANIKMNSSP